MKKKTGYSRVDDHTTLSQRLAKGTPQPATLPSGLPLSAIKLWPKVFQHRGFEGHASKSHVLNLTAAIGKSKSKTLDPITVWWDGKEWACIDGHHRYEAYRAAKLDSNHLIPVEAFGGPLKGAMGEAARANTGDKLSMTNAEKSDAAWHLVTMTDFSKEETATRARVSESTVAIMRRVYKQLMERETKATGDLNVTSGGDFRDLRWAEAKRLSEGLEAPDFDPDTANEKKAQAMALKLLTTLGAEGRKYPETLARALEIYDERLPASLTEWWGISDGDTEETEATGF